MALLALSGLFAFTSTEASAQFSVTPTILSVEPTGEDVGSLVRVRNEGGRALSMRVYARDFDQDSLGSHSLTTPGTSPNGCGDRISLVPAAFELPAGEDQLVSIRLQPASGEPATCWSIIFIESPPPADQTGIRVAARIGVKLFGLAEGGTRDARIEDAVVEEIGSERVIRLKLANHGSWPLLARGSVEIVDLEGVRAGEARIERTTVLPSRTRMIDVPLDVMLEPGRYVAVSLIELGDEELIGAQVAFRVEGG
jgi:P pilus assembly chaperone PapD